MTESLSNKARTGRPKGAKDRPRSQRMGELLGKLLLDGLKRENWPPICNPSTGEPIVDPKSGEVLRRPPSAAYLRECRQFLAGVGRLSKLEKAADGPSVADLVKEMALKGELRPRREPDVPESDEGESDEGERSWGARR